MYRLTESPDLVLRLGDGALIPRDHRWWDEYAAWLAEGHTPEPAPAAGLDAEKARALVALNESYEAEFASIKAQYPDAERESWPIQLSEAAALAADPQVVTPFLDALLVARGFGETKDELAAKVQGKHQAYAALTATLTGKRHALERQILSAVTAEEIRVVTW
jgi:hypothetical protein